MIISSSRQDIILCRPVFWFTVLSTYCVFLRMYFNLPEIVFNSIRYGITLVLILLSMKYWSNRTWIRMIVLELLFINSYLLSYLNGFSLMSNSLTYYVSTLLICVPFCSIAMSVNDINQIYQSLKHATYINIILLTIFLFSLRGQATYSMSASYQVLLCGMIHWIELTRSKKWKKVINLGLVILELFLMFVFGARGPLLCFAIFIVLQMVTAMQNTKKLLISGIVVSIIIAILALNWDFFMSRINNILHKYGLYSRTFELLKNYTILNNTGRSYYHDRTKTLVQQRPFCGYGAASDIAIMGQYPHSLFLELMFDFGIPLGVFFFVVISWKALSVLFEKDKLKKELCIVLLVNGYVMLFFSGTYLQNYFLFLLLGISIKNNHILKKRV